MMNCQDQVLKPFEIQSTFSARCCLCAEEDSQIHFEGLKDKI